MSNYSCQPNEADIFDILNIRRCEKYVRYIQQKLDRAVADDDKAKIRWYFHLLNKRSKGAKILAVYKITTLNQGKYTAGIDKIALPKGDRRRQNRFKQQLLSQIDVDKRPDPIRRVYIPKPNGKKRPLGIATLLDRCIQEIFRQALEPIVEYHFSERSFGFRPQRRCHDAIADLFGKLCTKNSRRWIVEGDISGCFDNLGHNHILNTLKRWHVPQPALSVLQRMLRAKICDQGTISDTETGTPQGSPLSPLLANVALTSLDNFCQERYGWKGKLRRAGKSISYKLNPISRYADDWVVVCRCKEEAETIKREIAQYLSETIGVELSDEKTHITEISEGFHFLGFHIRKYIPQGKKRSHLKKKSPNQERLLIKPQNVLVSDMLQ